jgi:hypothetical protein
MASPEPLPSAPAALVRTVQALEGYHYRFATEMQLHAGLAQALTREGIRFEQEKRASPGCRYDFWCPETSLVIEAKIHGSYAAALRQAERYVREPDCAGVIIAATPRWAARATAQLLNGKPVVVARLRPRAF